MENKENFEFITETIKERPYNRRKLIQKTMETVALAVIFGLIACFTFLVLEPVFSNWLYPKEAIEAVEIPEDIDEVLPEDMLAYEENVLEPSEEVINTIKNEINLDEKDYQRLYQNIYSLVADMKPATVTVTGVKQNIDWFNDPYKSTGQTTGFVLTENNQELLILVVLKELKQTTELEVTFFDQTIAAGTIKGTDANTGLAILAVEKSSLPKKTLDSVTCISLGSSRMPSLLASPIIAVGRPLGKTSVEYGMITSMDTILNMTDQNFRLLTTNIYGSTDASGLLMDFNGNVVGVINQSFNSKTTPNLISALGITELKGILQRMSNGIENYYLGIEGTDVPREIHESAKVPVGAYVTGIVMDSPAMKAGIQSGDVIVGINDSYISSFEEYSTALENCTSLEAVQVTLLRQGQSEYREVQLEIPLGVLQ